MRRALALLLPLVVAAGVCLFPQEAYAQVGSMAGVVRDSSGAVLPGVTVEVTSPALIEKVRTSVTDSNGRYQITALPVGTYSVSFTLTGFATARREKVIVSSDIVANVGVEMSVGNLDDRIDVTAEVPTVDITTPGVQHVLGGDEIAELPTQRDIPSLLNLVPASRQAPCAAPATAAWESSATRPCRCSTRTRQPATPTARTRAASWWTACPSTWDARAPASTRTSASPTASCSNTATAQEVAFTLSGSLGESETGGAAINIVPRTGGNRYSGNYCMTLHGDEVLRPQHAVRV